MRKSCVITSQERPEMLSDNKENMLIAAISISALTTIFPGITCPLLTESMIWRSWIFQSRVHSTDRMFRRTAVDMRYFLLWSRVFNRCICFSPGCL